MLVAALWSETIEKPLVREVTFPITDPNRSVVTLIYSCFIIKSLTLLFGQTMYRVDHLTFGF